MSYANDEIKYAICDVCGHEKKCFVTDRFDEEFNEELAVCSDCLRISDLD